MAQDVVPGLNEAINTSFESNMMKDRTIARISGKIRDGTATLEDGHMYAAHAGENMSKALLANLTAENLPDGTLYYNIAKRTVVPALETNYELTNEVAEQIQAIVDKKTKIGIKGVKADFPEERIQGLVDMMTADGITLEDALKWLEEPIVNNSEAFFDDYVDENARFRSEVGLKSYLIRTAEAKCCDWCAALEGTYEYGSEPPDIYRRHEYCRCSVTFKSEKKSQNVHTKREWSDTSENIEARREAGQRTDQTARERLEVARILQRDSEIKQYMSETGYNRETARMSTRNKSPAQIEADIQKVKERQAKIRGSDKK